MFLLGRHLFACSSAGLIAAWLLALSPVHISYSQVARGYSLLLRMAILSLYFLCRALANGKISEWGGFSCCSFLAAWTLPSGVFHLLCLGLWAATVASAARRKQAIGMALGSLVLIILVYLPIRNELVRAGARWGIDIWSKPMALSQLVLDIGNFWGNGLESLLPGIAAFVGLVIMLRKGRNIGLYIVLAWAVPVLAAAAMGVAGHPRTYFYLLPTFILAATCGIVYSVRSVRLHALVSGLMLSGCVGVAWRSLEDSAPDPYPPLAQFLQTNTASGDIVVSPFIMDVKLWSYARDIIAERLLAALSTQQVERLLFATSELDERFQLSSYLLKTNVAPTTIKFPIRSFIDVYHGSPLSLFQLSGGGNKIYPLEEITWRALSPNKEEGISVSGGNPALTDKVSIRLENPSQKPFQIYSSTRFTVAREGIILLLYGKTVKQSYLSLYVLEDGKDLGRPHMMRTAPWPVVVRGKDAQIWLLDAYLLPAMPGQAYGVYIIGGDKEIQSFTDVSCFFFPY